MTKANFITAIGTPLTEDEALHEEGLEKHLADQWGYDFGGVLVAGTMGAMQLLTDETYRRLIERSVELSKGKGEVLVGAGDAGFARTRDRIRYINDFDVDGVAVLLPYFWKFRQTELVAYYKALADISKAPLYIYDLPPVIGMGISTESLDELSKHPNIHGAKCSGDIRQTRQWIDRYGDDFRIIIANVELMDMIVHHGFYDLLDGMWAIAPAWTQGVATAGEAEDWATAADCTRKVTAAREVLVQRGMDVFTVFMNARGIPGCFAPGPLTKLTDAQRDEVLALPITQSLIQENPRKA